MNNQTSSHSATQHFGIARKTGAHFFQKAAALSRIRRRKTILTQTVRTSACAKSKKIKKKERAFAIRKNLSIFAIELEL